MPVTRRRVNLDGTRNVSCIHCNEFISTASAISGINAATCAVCQAGFDGIILTQDQVDEIRAVKVGDTVLSFTAANPKPVKDPMVAASIEDVELTTNRIGYFVKALVFSLRDTVKDAIADTPASKLLARSKRRKPIFSREIDTDKVEENTEED